MGDLDPHDDEVDVSTIRLLAKLPTLAAYFYKRSIPHADHEQNCSTSTVRVVGSSEANVFASISSGVHALSGPLHGGANAAVLEMLEGIRDADGNVDEFVTKVEYKEAGVKPMGFGHRVYKNYDPRAKIVKQLCDEILGKIGGDDELLHLAVQLEERALSDDYFISRKLYPNVDFYTGLIKEMLHDPATKIARPRQVYTGPTERLYAPIEAH